MGEREDGSDSIAVQVAPESHWLELEVLILVVSSEKKAVSSTRGMQTTVKTSPLMKYRCETVVPQRMEAMERAIVERDFPSFATLTMQDSNQFHAVCLDSYPPILYLNDTSKRVMQLVADYNELHHEEKVAYTFDAGPNAVLYCLRETVSELISLVTQYFPPTPGNEREKLPTLHHWNVHFRDYIRGISSEDCRMDSDSTKKLKLTFDPTPGLLQYIIHTSVGDGPRLLTQPLLGLNGLPLATTPPT